jgi:hypothetical protein
MQWNLFANEHPGLRNGQLFKGAVISTWRFISLLIKTNTTAYTKIKHLLKRYFG